MKIEHCAVCGLAMHEGNQPWEAEYVTEELFYLYRNLNEAGRTPCGLVCSDSCRSQAAYNSLGAEQQEAMKALLKGIDILAEALYKLGVGYRDAPMLEPFFRDVSAFYDTVNAINELESALKGEGNDAITWID